MTTITDKNERAMREGMVAKTATPNLQEMIALLEDKKGEVQARLHAVLGDRAPIFTQAVRNLLVAPENKMLRECTPKSIMRSCMACATTGLSLDPAFGQAAIVPFTETTYKNGQQVVTKKAVFMPMKNGLVQLANNTGMIQRLMAAPVYEGDIKYHDPFTGDMEYNQEPHERTKLLGYVAYLRYINGGDHYLYMTVEELEEHGKKYSKSYYNKNGLWQKNKPAMYEKTVIKRILMKWGSMDVMANSKLITALKYDMATPSSMDMSQATPEYVDGVDDNIAAVEEQEVVDVTDEPEK